ncbi:unnamed protein product, partial [marine sediment metagenome]
YWLLNKNGYVELNVGLDVFEVDELSPDNNLICIELNKMLLKYDIDGDQKYYMYDNAGTWELHEKDNWEEYIEDYE